MKRAIATLLSLFLALGSLTLCPAADKEKTDKGKKADDREKASLWMSKKLEYSQKILAGLTKADYDLIESNAQHLQVVGYLEAWDRSNVPEYRRQVRYFEDANKELIRQAKKKNISGATLAYTQLTQSCVQCHTVVRDAGKKK